MTNMAKCYIESNITSYINNITCFCTHGSILLWRWLWGLTDSSGMNVELIMLIGSILYTKKTIKVFTTHYIVIL